MNTMKFHVVYNPETNQIATVMHSGFTIVIETEDEVKNLFTNEEVEEALEGYDLIGDYDQEFNRVVVIEVGKK